MNPALIAPVVMLVAVLCTGAVVLQRDAYRRRVDRQLEIATPASAGLSGDQSAGADIRLRSGRRDSSRNLAYWLLRYEPDAPYIWPAWRVIAIAVLAAIAAAVLGQMAMPIWLAPVDGVITGLFVARGLFGWQRDRYADRLTRQLPDTIELIVSAVRAGLPVTEAFRGVAREMPEPTSGQFDRVVSELSLGRPPEECLLNLYHRTRVSEYAMFAVTLAVQAKAGGRLAETLQTLGDTVRQRVALAGRAKALSGEAKLSARVLASLPFLAAAALSFERPGFLDPLLQEPRGRVMFAIGITSLLLGIVTMRRMIKKGTTV